MNDSGRRWGEWLRRAVLVLLVFSALLVILTEVRKSQRLDVRTLGLDEVSLHERRMAPLRSVLPKRGVVGYLSDEVDETEAAKRFFLTQYALAPVLVSRGARGPLIVGNFTSPENSQRQTEGLAIVRDFGGGLVLYRRSAH